MDRRAWDRNRPAATPAAPHRARRAAASRRWRRGDGVAHRDGRDAAWPRGSDPERRAVRPRRLRHAPERLRQGSRMPRSLRCCQPPPHRLQEPLAPPRVVRHAAAADDDDGGARPPRLFRQPQRGTWHPLEASGPPASSSLATSSLRLVLRWRQRLSLRDRHRRLDHSLRTQPLDAELRGHLPIVAQTDHAHTIALLDVAQPLALVVEDVEHNLWRRVHDDLGGAALRALLLNAAQHMDRRTLGRTHMTHAATQCGQVMKLVSQPAMGRSRWQGSFPSGRND